MTEVPGTARSHCVTEVPGTGRSHCVTEVPGTIQAGPTMAFCEALLWSVGHQQFIHACSDQ